MKKTDYTYQAMLAWVLEFEKEDPTKRWNITITRYIRGRTLAQNAFFHELCGYIGHQSGMDPALIKAGIKETYGFKVKVMGRLVPKPSHLCNRLEEMSSLIEGCFLEASEQIPVIDMSEYTGEWREIKKKRDKAK